MTRYREEIWQLEQSEKSDQIHKYLLIYRVTQITYCACYTFPLLYSTENSKDVVTNLP